MALLPLLSSTAVKIDCCYEQYRNPQIRAAGLNLPSTWQKEGRERREKGGRGRGELEEGRRVYSSSPFW